MTENTEKEFLTNVRDGKFLNTLVYDTFKEIRDIVSKSYGPLGANTIIADVNKPKVTKDGFTILNSIRFSKVEQMYIFNLIRAISAKLVDKVGDGSTSAIMAGFNLYNELSGFACGNDNYRISDVKNGLTKIQDILIDIIQKEFKVSYDELTEERKLEILKYVATVSNNNDANIGEQIADIMYSLYNESCQVELKVNPKDNAPLIDYDVKNGYSEKSYRMASPVILSKIEKVTIEEPFIIQCDGIHEREYANIAHMREEITTQYGHTKVLIVVCQYIDQDVYKDYVKFVIKSTAGGSNTIPNLIIIESGMLSSASDVEKFNDLSVYLNTSTTKANMALSYVEDDEKDDPVPDIASYIGMSKEVILMKDAGITFVGGYGETQNRERFDEHIKSLEEKLTELTNIETASPERGRIKNRLMRLNGSLIRVFVGGRTFDEKENNKYLVEDSIYACKSVIQEGFTIGGNTTPLYATLVLLSRSSAENDLSSLEVDLLMSIHSAYVSLVKANGKLLESSEFKCNDVINNPKDNLFIYNLVNDKVENINDTKILAPVNTDIEILKTSFSIITLLLTSNQIII
jgi:chaperonin GroEL